jgi:hypothetical protein
MSYLRPRRDKLWFKKKNSLQNKLIIILKYPKLTLNNVMLPQNLLLAVCLLVPAALWAQPAKITSTMYSARQADSVLAGTDKQALGLEWPVFRAWKYADRSGTYFCALTESRDTIITDKDTASYHIRAVFLKQNGSQWQKYMELNDHANIHEDLPEWTIWFWTRYCSFSDLDGDGLADPLVVYGSSQSMISRLSDGRLKIILWRRGQKYAIRHTNSSLDNYRETQVDTAWYKLPAKIQAAVTAKMELMTKNGHCIFPYGWQKNMRLKKTFFSERP